MGKNLNDLEYVEQELAELRNNLQKSFAVLDGLAKVQAQFEGLAQTYKHLKENLDNIEGNREQVAQLESTFNQRFAEIGQVIESRWQEFRNEILQVQNELGTADLNLSNYNAELAKQVGELKEDVEERLEIFLKEWASYKEDIRAPLDEFVDAKLTRELEAFRKQLSLAGFNNQHFEKQQRLESQLNLATSSLDEVERRVHSVERKLSKLEVNMRAMNRWLLVSVLTTVLAVVLVLLTLGMTRFLPGI